MNARRHRSVGDPVRGDRQRDGRRYQKRCEQCRSDRAVFGVARPFDMREGTLRRGLPPPGRSSMPSVLNRTRKRDLENGYHRPSRDSPCRASFADDIARHALALVASALLGSFKLSVAVDDSIPYSPGLIPVSVASPANPPGIQCRLAGRTAGARLLPRNRKRRYTVCRSRQPLSDRRRRRSPPPDSLGRQFAVIPVRSRVWR